MNDGIHTISADDYYADRIADQPALSATIARTLIAKSPLHAWWEHPRLGGGASKHTDATDTGTILHSLILEGDQSKIAVINATDFRTKDAKEQRDAARVAGLIPVKYDDWQEIVTAWKRIDSGVKQHTARPAVFTDGKPEQTLVWTDNGVTCKARIDWLRDDHACIDDLKTTKMSVGPTSVQRTVFNSGYDVQAAFYLRGLRKITGKTAQFRFVFCEVEPPYAVTVVDLSPAALALADEKVEWAISEWRKCVAADRWPGYPNRVATLDPPGWSEAQWSERLYMEEAA